MTASPVSAQHDDAHRLIGQDQSNGEKVRYTLDNAGRILQTQTFDAQNNLTAKGVSMNCFFESQFMLTSLAL